MLNGNRSLAWSLGLSYAAMMCLAIASSLLPVFLTTIRVDLGGRDGLSNEQLGRISAFTFTGLMLAIAVTGPLADRIGVRIFAVLGSLLVGAGLVILGTAHRYHDVLLAVLVMGFGAGSLDTVLSPIVSALQPHRRSSAMNWLHAFYCIGAVATALTASLALRLGAGWRSISLWLTLMPAAMTIGFLTMKIPPLVAAGHQRMKLRRLRREPHFVLALLAIFLAGATEVGMSQWLPDYAEKGLRYSTFTGGMTLSGFLVAMAVSRMSIGGVGHQVDPIRLMVACGWAEMILILLAAFAPWPPVALAACVMTGLAAGCFWPTILAVAADRFPHGGASLFAMLAAVGNLGCICMPWLVGVTTDHAGLHWALATIAACPLLLVILLPRIKGTSAVREVAAVAA